jgi:hypothetical protein
MTLGQCGEMCVELMFSSAVYLKALAAGGESVVAPNNTFWGDRAACVRDFADNQWWIATRLENLKPEEIQKRANVFFEQPAKHTP